MRILVFSRAKQEEESGNVERGVVGGVVENAHVICGSKETERRTAKDERRTSWRGGRISIEIKQTEATKSSCAGGV